MDGEIMELNGLPFEYEQDYGTACGDLDVAHIVNNPAASGKCRVFSLRLKEEPLYSGFFHAKATGGESAPAKNLHAVALGKLGGPKGGRARAEKLTPEQRSEIASRAARVRWKTDQVTQNS